MNAEIVARLHNSFVWEDVGKEEAAFKEIVAKLQDDHEFYQRLGESLMHHLRQRAAERAEAARNLAALQKKKSR